MAKAQAVLALQGGSSAAIYDNVAVTTLNPIMSRGLGHIERTILRMVERQRRRKQRVSFDALDIVLNAYPHREGRDSRAHFVAVHRALHSFVRKHLQFALVGGKGGDWTLFRVGTVGLPSRLIDCRASRLLIGKS